MVEQVTKNAEIDLKRYHPQPIKKINNSQNQQTEPRKRPHIEFCMRNTSKIIEILQVEHTRTCKSGKNIVTIISMLLNML